MANPGKYFRIIFNNPERRERYFSKYIHHRNLYTKGNGELSFVWAIINPQGLMIAWLFLKTTFPGIPLWVLYIVFPVSIILKAIAKWWFGCYWDKKRLFEYEHDWSNKRDPIMKEISKEMLNGKGLDIKGV